MIEPNYKDFFEALFFTGARPSELTALRWPYVDLNNERFEIRVGRVRGKEDEPKTEGSRRIADMGAAINVFRRMREKTILRDRREGYVFLGPKGKPLEQNNLRNRIWYPALKVAKVRRRDLYQCRHTFITLALAAGESVDYLALQCGTSAKMIHENYRGYIPNLTRRDGSAIATKFQAGGE